MEQENKKNNRKYLAYVILFVVVLIVATAAITYAYFKVDTSKTDALGSITATADCLDISYSEEDVISLSEDYPISDEYALANVIPVTVTVTNNCATNLTDVSYALAITSLSNTTGSISDDKIRMNVKRQLGTASETTLKETDYLSNLSKLTDEYVLTNLNADLDNRSSVSNYTDRISYMLDSATIAADSVNTYKIYLWVDYYEGDAAAYTGATHDKSYDNTTEGLKFAAAISLIVNPTKEEAVYLSEYVMALAGNGQVFDEGEVGYRYAGASVNNYVSFNDESWQIIGVEEGSKIGLTSGEYYTKLIIGSNMSGSHFESMYDTAGTNSWPTSSLYSTLNGSYYTGLSSNAKSMIVSADWYYNAVSEDYYMAFYPSDWYAAERSDKTVAVNDYVGIMYPSDYAYASPMSTCSETEIYNYEMDCINYNWMWDGLTTLLITSSETSNYIISDVGYLTIGSSENYYVRPVVYLDSDIVISNYDADVEMGSYNNKFEISK